MHRKILTNTHTYIHTHTLKEFIIKLGIKKKMPCNDENDLNVGLQGVVKILLCFGPKGSYFNCLITGCWSGMIAKRVLRFFLLFFVVVYLLPESYFVPLFFLFAFYTLFWKLFAYLSCIPSMLHIMYVYVPYIPVMYVWLKQAGASD